jgi:methyl-accepting chemotaxis protein
MERAIRAVFQETGDPIHEILRRDLQMDAISNPARSESSDSSLPAKRQLVEKVAVDPADLKDDQSQSEPPRLGRRPLAAMITFCIGVAATLTWQSYGDTARKAIATSFPRLAWLAPQTTTVAQNTSDIFAPATAVPSPDQPHIDAISLDLDQVRQSIDRIATTIAADQGQMTHSIDRIAASQEQLTRSVERIAASQEQMTRTVAQLAAGQEQVTREITKLQAIEQQYVLYRNSKPLAPRPVPQPSQGQTVR